MCIGQVVAVGAFEIDRSPIGGELHVAALALSQHVRWCDPFKTLVCTNFCTVSTETHPSGI